MTPGDVTVTVAPGSAAEPPRGSDDHADASQDGGR